MKSAWLIIALLVTTVLLIGCSGSTLESQPASLEQEFADDVQQNQQLEMDTDLGSLDYGDEEMAAFEEDLDNF
ncbi:MAG TPA: hypothetical protein VJB87_03735 [Candidatus Nanoarchaeia archaeon]|nr:hypothetical protein [Candidatus Nanoarchaeia archaeon]